MLDPIRAVWVDEGNDANPAKYAAHGITSAFFSIRDPEVVQRIAKAKAAGLGGGIFFAWNWYPKLSGSVLADVVSHELSILGYDDYATDGVAVLADIEDHDIAGYVVPFFQRWRQHRPKRATYWTLEGMQGGIIPASVPPLLSSLRVVAAPSMYAGNMVPLPHDVTQDLLIAGFDADHVVGMMDAADLPYSWRGFAFTQGRLA